MLSYYYLGEYEKAISILTEALLLSYKSDEIYYYIGKSYNELEEQMHALEAFKQSVILNPEHGYSHFELGSIYESILKINLALDEYKLANRYKVETDSLYYKYGKLLYTAEQYKDAMSPLRKYIINHPNDYNILVLLGDIFYKENRYPEAIDTYLRLIDQFPYEENYYLQIANAAIIFFTRIIILCFFP